MENKITSEMIEDLKEALIKIDSEELCEKFIADLLTATEVEQLAQRLRAAKLLSEGKTYAQIIALTDISSATLSRVNNCLRRGSGGYSEILKRLQ